MIENIFDVGGSCPTRTHTRNKAALLLELVGCVLRIEHHSRVEIRKEHDEQYRKYPVDPTRCKRICKGLNPIDTREEHRELRGHVQQSRSKDDRHNACRIHLDRQIGGLTSHNAATHHTLSILNRNSSLTALNKDDNGHDSQNHQKRHYSRNHTKR